MIRYFLPEVAITRKLLKAIDSLWMEPKKFIKYAKDNGDYLSETGDIMVICARDIDQFNYYKKRIECIYKK